MLSDDDLKSQVYAFRLVISKEDIDVLIEALKSI
jgi:hypothetical protein